MSDNRMSTKLNKIDKAAILLLSLGETDAAQVLQHMGPKEVQRVGSAMAQMRNVHREQVEQVMSEFVEVVSDQTGLGVGADGYIRKMLTQALAEYCLHHGFTVTDAPSKIPMPQECFSTSD